MNEGLTGLAQHEVDIDNNCWVNYPYKTMLLKLNTYALSVGKV